MCATLGPGSRLHISPRSRQEDSVMRRLVGGVLFSTILVGAAHAFWQATPALRSGDPAAPPTAAIRRVLPKEPAEALASIRVRDDFVIDLIAQEPLVNDPVAFA